MNISFNKKNNQLRIFTTVFVCAILIFSVFSTLSVGKKAGSSDVMSDEIHFLKESTEEVRLAQSALEQIPSPEKNIVDANTNDMIEYGNDDYGASGPQGYILAPTWPTSWILYDEDPTENGPNDDYRDVHYAYYNISEEYLYHRMECYGYPDFTLHPDARYKVFIDLDCPHNMVRQGGMVYEAEFILLIEDTDNDHVGDIYLVSDVDNDGDYSEYSPWTSMHPQKIIDTNIAGYRIINKNIDLYIALDTLGDTSCLFFTWATDNEDPTVDQTSEIDRSDSFWDNDILISDLSIVKSDDNDPVYAGTQLTYSLLITNQGPHIASGVIISDTLSQNVTFLSAIPGPSGGSFPTYTWIITTLAVGATVRINITVQVNSDTSGILTNNASVTCTSFDPFPGNNNDSEDTLVNLPQSNIFIEKSPDVQSVNVGQTATFSITVVNTGETVLTNVVVSDTQCPDCDKTIGMLNVGQSYNYTCSGIVTDDFTNVATVRGWYGAFEVTDSDTASVIVIYPSISIEKSPNEQEVVMGQTATFSITVLNTGKIPLSNVVVQDSLCPDCDEIIGTLNAGQSHTYSCTCVANEDFINSATVFGWYGTYQVTDTDLATVEVVGPKISIEKSPDSQEVIVGQTALFTITVTNTGDTYLANIVVSDPLCPECDVTIPSLSVGETYTYTCSCGVTEDFINLITVSGWYGSYQVTSSDSAVVDAISPAISIDKSPDFQEVLFGQTATFSITVTNTGDKTVTSVVVSDSLCPDCVENIGTLTVGQSYNYTCSCVVTEDFTNVATVSGLYGAYQVTSSDAASVDAIGPSISISKSPDEQMVIVGQTATFEITVTNTGDRALTNVIVSDPLCPDCNENIPTLNVGQSYTYTCSRIVTEDFTNMATVTGWYGTYQVAANDTAHVEVNHPSISITKSPDEQIVIVGQMAIFSITVINTGDTMLTNIVIDDPLCPDCDETLLLLLSGESHTYICSCVVSQDFTNVVTVSGWFGSYKVTDSDEAIVDVVYPSIAIVKSPDIQEVVSGQLATFTVTVINTCDVALTNVAVSDPFCPNCNVNIGKLDVGKSYSYNCSGVVTEDFTNVATVTGWYGTYQVTANDTAYIDVIGPEISITKSPDTQDVVEGQTATFTIIVTNIGETILTNLVVSDPFCPDCGETIGTLNVGQSYNYTCSGSVTEDFTNVATVTGSYGIYQVTDSDTAYVNVVTPAISIEKSPDIQVIIVGQTATFSITVANTGETPLTNIIVSDPLCPDCGVTIGSLAVGASYTYTCDCIVIEDFTNIATVSGWYGAYEATASDTAYVNMVSPAISIAKSPDTQEVIIGQMASFTITVTNTGDTNLTDVEVSDPICLDCDQVIGSLDAGESYTYSCSGIVTADYTNMATVHGWYGTYEVTASDTAFVDMIGPEISIEKSPDMQEILIGGIATFTITVTNTGDVELTDVEVTDPLCPDCDVTIGTLAVGALYSFSCSCVVTADFTNIATVSGWYTTYQVAAYDTAFVDVLTPNVDVEKYVYNESNGKWEEEIRVVEGIDLPFKIIVRNVGEIALTNVIVTDELSSQLEYISESANMTPITFDDYHVNWTIPTLPVGDAIEITFEAHTAHLCYGWNKVTVTATENGVSDRDLVPVKVISEGQPLVDITKKVWDEHTEQWVDLLYCFKDEILTFQLTIVSTSLDTLDINVIDMLPMQFEYRDNASTKETYVSPDFRTIMWNVTIDPGETIVIQYQAEAVHHCQGTNIAIVNLSGCDVDMDSVLVKVFDDSDEFPPIIQLISPKEGDVLSGVETIRWFAIDDDLLGEELPIYIYYSSDNIHWMQVGDVHCNNIDLDHGSFEWDTNNIASGKYTLLVEAYTGLVGYDSMTIFISGQGTGMKIDTSIRDLSTGNTQFVRNGDTVEIKAAITGVLTNDITREDITADLSGFNRGTVIAQSFNGFIASWTLYQVECTPTNGRITVEINAGKFTATEVTITADNIDPTLSIIQPVNGLYFFNSRIPLLNRTIIVGSITIQIETDDNYAVDRAEFYVDSKLEHTISEQPMEWYINLPKGKHLLDVKVYDDAGNTVATHMKISKFI